MRKGLLIGACVMVVGLLMLASIPTDFRTSAGPAVPHNTWGDAYLSGGGPIADSETITSWIDGVMYGTNVTFGSTYDIDTSGNNTLDETPEVKEGGWYGDPIMYVHGNGTSFDTNMIFEESSTWDQGISENFDLNEADLTVSPFDTFSWLVINDITVDSAALNGIDYVRIHNPAGGVATNLWGNYAFQKNDGMDVSASPMFPIGASSLEPNLNLGAMVAGDTIWVNLSAISGLTIESADELKLVWMNPGGAGAPFNGSDVIVDRVEWGNQSMEPDNTTMPDAPAAMNTISRVVEGQDTNDCWVDFVAGPETPWVPFVPPQIVVTASRNVNDIQLDWPAEPLANGYKVYWYNNSTFEGFVLDKGNPNDVLIGSGSNTWLHPGAYGDTEDYGYIVRSFASGGENTTDWDNIAYKHIVSLSAGDNYLALPSLMDPAFDMADTLEGDIGSGAAAAQWDSGSGTWDTSNFALPAGFAIRVAVTGATQYKIVGAHRSAAINIPYAAQKGGILQYIALPYHTTVMTADELILGIGSAGRVANWDNTDGLWQSWTATMVGMDFNLTPGMGYLVALTASNPTYQPAVKVF